MAEIVNYLRRCKITKGGIKRFYLLPYVPYSPFEILSDGMELIQFPRSDIYLFECEGQYSQNSEVQNGAFFFKQSASMSLPIVYNSIDILIFLRQQYSVIVLTNNGDNIIFGTHNGMDCNVNNSSGLEKAEFNGFSLDFDGKEEKTGLWISDLSRFFDIKTGNLLNATLNFKV